MRILVTGGTGFFGRHLVWGLAGDGHELVFTGRNRAAADTVLQHALPAQPRFVPLDHGATDAASRLTEAAIHADAVVHCAAQSAPWGTPQMFRQANVDSTREVIAACLSNAVPRLIHISTPSLYFCYADRLNIREDDPLPPPVNHYAATKREAESLVWASGIRDCVILRPRALFGPWDNTLMPRLLRVIHSGTLPLPWGGKALLDLTHIDNAVQAVRLALTRDRPAARSVYNVSNGEPIAFKDFIALLRTELGIAVRTRSMPYVLLDIVARLAEAGARMRGGETEPRLTRYGVATIAFSQTLNLDAIRRDLGYVPQTGVREGIARYGDWLRAISSG